MHRVRILKPASREFARLDKPVGRRIAERINWLAENLDQVNPEALSGDLAGFYKLRVGDYRVVYEILSDERIIVIHSIGHRSQVYRRR